MNNSFEGAAVAAARRLRKTTVEAEDRFFIMINIVWGYRNFSYLVYLFCLFRIVSCVML